MPDETKTPVPVKEVKPEVKTVKPIHIYVLVDEKTQEESGQFKGRQPRQAALKAANVSTGTKAAPVIIRLRQRGDKKIHIFKGWKEVVPAPAYKPSWMPDKINKPFVSKVGIEKLEKMPKE